MCYPVQNNRLFLPAVVVTRAPSYVERTWWGLKSEDTNRTNRHPAVREWRRNFALPLALTQILSPNVVQGDDSTFRLSSVHPMSSGWHDHQMYGRLFTHPVRSVQALFPVVSKCRCDPSLKMRTANKKDGGIQHKQGKMIQRNRLNGSIDNGFSICF